MEKKELVCVNCPKGCRITVTMDGNKILLTEGYSCEKGKAYAEQETICPKRILTTTVKITGCTFPVLPVITSEEIPLEKMHEAMEIVRTLSVTAPIKMNDVIVEDFIAEGVNLIASRSMESCEC